MINKNWSIKYKSRLYKSYMKNHSSLNKEKYISYKNKLTQIIRKSKRSHYTDFLQASQGDCRRSWNVLNEVLNRRHRPTALPDLDVAKADLAQSFNHHYASIDVNLSKKISQPKGVTFKHFLTGSYIH